MLSLAFNQNQVRILFYLIFILFNGLLSIIMHPKTQTSNEVTLFVDACLLFWGACTHICWGVSGLAS